MQYSGEEVIYMIPSQMLKGTLEGCILKVIDEKETYGYEISERLRTYGFFDISEGTIYPMLLRLEKNKMITARKKESPVGPKRKYFSLTSDGKKELHNFFESWEELCAAVDNVFKEQ